MIDDKRAAEERMAARMAELSKKVSEESESEKHEPPQDEIELEDGLTTALEDAGAYMVVHVLHLRSGVATVPVMCVEDKQEAKRRAEQFTKEFQASVGALLVEKTPSGTARSLGVTVGDLLARLGITGLETLAQPFEISRANDRVLRNREKARRRKQRQ